MRYRVKNVTKIELSRATLKEKKNVARILSRTGQGRTETLAYKNPKQHLSSHQKKTPKVHPQLNLTVWLLPVL